MSAVAYKCPNCGGELTFDPNGQQFKCDYCISKFTKQEMDDVAPKNLNDEDADSPVKEQVDENGAVYYTCPSCGGEIITNSTTAATQCYYCHNPVVLSGRLNGDFLPSRLIPFKYDKATAINKFITWTKTKKYLVKNFFDKDQIENLTGVYFPYWIIDADVEAKMNAEGKKIKSWTTGNKRYTETSIYNITRNGDIHLEDIVKSALSKANKQLVESVQPFNEQELIPFTMAYLSGFSAEKRDIEREQLENEVNNDIKTYSENILKEQIKGYNSIAVSTFAHNAKVVAWEYGLLPVWTMTYKYNDILYYFAMNGQNGYTFGKLPVDKKKLFISSLITAAATLAICLLGGYII